MKNNKLLKVLFATSEAAPFSKSGGLGDVNGSLPRVLNRKVDCRVITPLYGPVDPKYGKVAIDKNNMRFIGYIIVPVAWRREYCGIYETMQNGVMYYFLDNMKYFQRDVMYGAYDDGERFSFFCRAVFEALLFINFKPDIINASDWQTALIPILQDRVYSKYDWYANIKTVFTIHNIAYQGQFSFDILSDVFDLPYSAKSYVEYDGCINLMKGAIETAYSVVTVSKTYVDEIAGNNRSPGWYDFGRGLTGIINARINKFKGILNGLDKDIDPMADENIYVNYCIDTFVDGKAANKLELQRRLGLEERADVPLIAMITRIDPGQKGCQLVVEALNNGLLDETGAQFMFIGNTADGDWDGKNIENDFQAIGRRYEGTGKMATYIGFSPELSQKLYAGADIFLVPSLYEPCGLTQMTALKYGTIPVVRKTGGLADTVTEDGCAGNGFVFNDYSHEDLSNAIRRAVVLYWDRPAWEALTRRAMECDFSWDAGAADEYIRLFESLLV